MKISLHRLTALHSIQFNLIQCYINKSLKITMNCIKFSNKFQFNDNNWNVLHVYVCLFPFLCIIIITNDSLWKPFDYLTIEKFKFMICHCWFHHFPFFVCFHQSLEGTYLSTHTHTHTQKNQAKPRKSKWLFVVQWK